MGTFYVTTPIYYVNGSPHIGHAYTTIVADALARYHRSRGDEVFFMTGTDEHGLKVQREAEQFGCSPQELADSNSKKFRDLFDRFHITYDRYIRTTEAEHKRVVLELYRRMVERGDIYLSKYEGWYAAADEAFYDEAEIADGKAIATGAPVEWVAEESYFFRLSAYQDRLLQWYREHPTCIQPESRYNEVVSFVEGGLQDLSISRTTFNWGIALPDDPKHVLYVWVDALTNYISGLGAFSDDPNWKTFWPCDLHLLGKDILRFHTVYWPAFLMSADVPTPKQLFVHGWWLVEGEKMSKRAGNWIDPNELADAYPLDLIRYYMLREVPFGNDGNFALERLFARNNADLADNFGNLVNRSAKMVHSFLGGKLGAPAQRDEADQQLALKAHETWSAVEHHMSAREIHRALEAILTLSSELNLYLQQNQPWRLAKNPEQRERLSDVLANTFEGIRWVATLLSPFLPDASTRVLDALHITDRSFASLTWGAGWSQDHAIDVPDVLFAKLEAPRTDEESIESTAAASTTPNKGEKKARQQQKEQKKQKEADVSAQESADAVEGTKKIGFDAFQAVELRVGLVVSAARVEGSEKLLLLKVDVGEAEPRTVVAGIGRAYDPETLEGNRYAVVTNLKPAKIFGIKSEAMMLAADTAEGGLSLASFPDTVTPGTRIG